MALTFYSDGERRPNGREVAQGNHGFRDRLAQVIDANSVVWPKPVYDLLNKHKASMLDVGSCLESASEFSSAKNTEAFKAVAIAAFCEYLDGPLHINTKEWRLTGEDMKRIAPTLFFNNDKVAFTAMREDLRKDKLGQSIRKSDCYSTGSRSNPISLLPAGRLNTMPSSPTVIGPPNNCRARPRNAG